eukprot:10272487-Lingulodinium_polyedra.AAC.1
MGSHKSWAGTWKVARTLTALPADAMELPRAHQNMPTRNGGNTLHHGAKPNERPDPISSPP